MRFFSSVVLYRNDLVKSMNKLDSLKNLKVMVPSSVFEYVDKGLNPEVFTRDQLEQTLEHNMFVKGKMDALESFEKLLEEELAAVYPDMVAQFREQLPAATKARPDPNDLTKDAVTSDKEMVDA
eukprot:Colp12_sorted_trinity150504_noHs@35844